MYKILLLLIVIPVLAYPQSMRSMVNDGVEQYDKGNYVDAEVNFRKGLEKEPGSFEANYNLGDSYYKQEKYNEALDSFNKALKLTESKNVKGKVYHNIGNSLLKSGKIEDSIEAYKNALRHNPDDMDTKYNLSYAMELLKQQQNKDQKKDDKKNDDKNKDDKQDDQQQQNQDDKKQDDKNQQQDKQQQNQSPVDQKAQQDNMKQKEEQMSKEEAEQILNAIKNNEQDLQKKLRKKTGVRVNTEKDW